MNITPVPEGSVTLSLLVDNTQNSVAIANSVANAYMALPENVGKVTILIETRPQGNDGDNVIKTRLATNDMADIFWYNSGSLLSALHPADTLVDLSAEPYMADLADSFKQTVTGPDGTGVYGVPYQTAMGGGILYNKRIFAENNLTVPDDVGRVRGEQRCAQDSGHCTGWAELRGRLHMDVTAVRARGLLQRPGR